MTTPDLVVPLRALGTDVDVHVGGYLQEMSAQAVRDRWHLCLRKDDGTGEGGPPRTVRAVLPVHLYGQPVDVPAVRDLASRFGLWLLEG